MRPVQLTNAAGRILTAAADLATQAGDRTVEPMHLLQAVLQDESEGAELLVRIGIGDSEDSTHPPRDRNRLSAVPNPEQSDAFTRVRERATFLARRFGGREVSSEHLAVALIEIDNSIRQKVADCGVEPDTLRSRLANSVAVEEAIEIDFEINFKEDGQEDRNGLTPTRPALRLVEGEADARDNGSHAPKAAHSEKDAETAAFPIRPISHASIDPTIARLIDACANRCREGLRVVEDYVRFIRDDAETMRDIKELRHGFAAAIRRIPDEMLLASRNTLGDVGTSITTEAERLRSSPRDIAAASLKRVQESLRSMEEFGKLIDVAFAGEVEALRYRSYDIERRLLIATPRRTRLEQSRLYLLLPAELPGRDVLKVAEAALAGGVDIIQLREKSADDRTIIEIGSQLRRLTREHDALFIVNDRPDLCRLLDADGVHVGQDDFPVAEARTLAGQERLIGLSTHSVEQVEAAHAASADYIGVGPTFPSSTKIFETFTGIDLLRDATIATTLPAFAIGGINAANIDEVLSAGFRRIAVSGAILNAENPRTVAEKLRTALGELAT